MAGNGTPKIKGKTTRRQAKLVQWVLLAQGLSTLVIGALVGALGGLVPGYSALLGGLIYLLPALYQARKVLTNHHSNNIRRTLRDLYKSEIWKMALTMVLFGIVFTQVRPIEPFSLFGAFIVMQVIAWVAPLVQNRKLLR